MCTNHTLYRDMTPQASTIIFQWMLHIIHNEIYHPPVLCVSIPMFFSPPEKTETGIVVVSSAASGGGS